MAEPITKNPETKYLPVKNTWYKIAENVNSGVITIQEHKPSRYHRTFRKTGDPAPVGFEQAIICCGKQIILDFKGDVNIDDGVDIYMRCKLANGEVVIAV